jgi:hypothetical protein
LADAHASNRESISRSGLCEPDHVQKGRDIGTSLSGVYTIRSGLERYGIFGSYRPIRAHLALLADTDFFTVEFLTLPADTDINFARRYRSI